MKRELELDFHFNNKEIEAKESRRFYSLLWSLFVESALNLSSAWNVVCTIQASAPPSEYAIGNRIHATHNLFPELNVSFPFILMSSLRKAL